MNYSVRALATLTGVPVNTLRTWERRYGLGAAARTGGGQRLYGADAVEHIQLALRAMERGHRASEVLAISTAELHALLGGSTEPEVATRVVPPSTVPAAPTASVPGRAAAPARTVAHPWLAHVVALDTAELTRVWRAGVGRSGVEAFILNEVVPFLRVVGTEWAEGRVQVFEEHFAAEALVEFLSSVWHGLAELNHGPIAVCAALPGEDHILGLHMVACAVAAGGWRLVFLGRDTPLPDLLAAAERSGARAVLLSFVGRSTPAHVLWEVHAIRDRLPRSVGVAVGGAGTPVELPPGVDAPALGALRGWLEAIEAQD